MIKEDRHLHSNFSDDAKDSMEAMAAVAVAHGYTKIAFTDHVRRSTPTLEPYLQSLATVRACFPNLTILSGIEAKIIDLDGTIDAQPEFYQSVDLVLASFHKIPKGKDQYFSEDEIQAHPDEVYDAWLVAFKNVLKNSKVHIIAHVTGIFRRYDLVVPPTLNEQIVEYARDAGKIFDINGRYNVPSPELLVLLKQAGVRLQWGSDAHSVEEFIKLQSRYPYEHLDF